MKIGLLEHFVIEDEVTWACFDEGEATYQEVVRAESASRSAYEDFELKIECVCCLCYTSWG